METKHFAETLYFQTELTKKQIAEKAGISTKTLFLWMKAGQWQRLKETTRQLPAQIVEDFYNQLTELNQNIRQREPGNRLPTRQEAEISRKIILNIDKIKKQASLAENMQVLTNFTRYLTSIDPAFAQQAVQYADKYLRAKAINGYCPYEPEYEDSLNEDPVFFENPIHKTASSEIEEKAEKEEMPTQQTQQQKAANQLTNKTSPLESGHGCVIRSHQQTTPEQETNKKESGNENVDNKLPINFPINGYHPHEPEYKNGRNEDPVFEEIAIHKTPQPEIEEKAEKEEIPTQQAQQQKTVNQLTNNTSPLESGQGCVIQPHEQTTSKEETNKKETGNENVDNNLPIKFPKGIQHRNKKYITKWRIRHLNNSPH